MMNSIKTPLNRLSQFAARANFACVRPLSLLAAAQCCLFSVPSGGRPPSVRSLAAAGQLTLAAGASCGGFCVTGRSRTMGVCAGFHASFALCVAPDATRPADLPLPPPLARVPASGARRSCGSRSVLRGRTLFLQTPGDVVGLSVPLLCAAQRVRAAAARNRLITGTHLRIERRRAILDGCRLEVHLPP